MQHRARDLAAVVKRQGLAPAYLLSGDEPLQRSETLDLLRREARARGFEERIVFEAGGKFDWRQLQDSAAELSLFSARRLIEVHITGKGPGLEGSQSLREYASRPPPDDVLIVTCGQLGAKEKSAAWVKALERLGDSVIMEKVDAARLPAWIQARAGQRGLRLAGDAAALLADRVEGNLLAAAQEIELLALLHPSGELGAAEVLATVADSARHNAFELTECAFAGQAGRALRMLESLRRDGTDAVPVAWVVVRDMRTLCLAAAAVERGEPLEPLFSRRDINVWASRRPAYKAALRRHRMPVLLALFRYALAVDRICKGAGRGEPWQMLSWLLLRLAGKPVAGGLFNPRVN